MSAFIRNSGEWQRPIQGLDEWLCIAIDDLAPPAQERITQEIESHFHDALDAYQAEGQNEPEARTRALMDLGDPGAAQKRFRKCHLTKAEAKSLAEMWNDYRKSSKSAYLVLGFCYSVVFAILAVGYHFRGYIDIDISTKLLGVWIGEILLFFTSSVWIARNNRDPGFIGQLYTLCVLDRLFSLIFCLWVIRTCGGSSGLIWGLGGVGFSLMRDSTKMFQVIPLWLKIQRMDDFSKEVPPKCLD
jgi:hypothetical protein